MKHYCKNHPDKIALSFCHSCGDYYCPECLNEGLEYYYCKKEKCNKIFLAEMNGENILFVQIGPFNQLFKKNLYLRLLRPYDAEGAIATIQNAVKQSTNLEKEIQILLEDDNWRPHLVASVTLLMIKSVNLSNYIWNRFDQGSWVNPQLAIAAYFHDPLFSQNAKERLAKRCPIKFNLSRSMSTLEFHSATGGGGEYQTSCKSLSALMTICKTIPSFSDYITELSAIEDVKKMLKDDVNETKEITNEWLSRITIYFRELKINLTRSEN